MPMQKETRPAGKQGARNVLTQENSKSLTPWTGGAQIALTLPFLLGMAAVFITEVIKCWSL